MAAMDFPANPTNGQVYGNYIYSTATGAWNAKPLTGPKTVNSDTAPASPQAGDQWFNTTTGVLYIWVVDVDSAQWVESQAPITANGYYSPNYIINGGFDIWQRGTSQTTSGYGSADRWSNVTSGTTTISQETTDLPATANVRYGIKFVTGASSSFGQFYTALESADVMPLRGKTMTLSAYVKVAGSYAGNWQMKAYSSNSVDTPLSSVATQIGATQNIATAATTSWVRVTYTFTMPSDAVGFKIEFSPDTVQPSGVTVRMAGVQLEQGNAATPFRRNANSIQGELAACQRYYYRRVSGASVGFLAAGRAASASYVYARVEFPVSMRVKPYAIENSGTMQVYGYSNTGISAISLATEVTKDIGVLTAACSVTNGWPYDILSNGDVNAFIGFNAEL